MEYKDIIGKEIIFAGEQCFIAAVDPGVGITVKRLDDKDPDNYRYCYDVEKAKKHPVDPEVLFCNRVVLLREKDIITWDDIEHLQQKEGYLSGIGSGECPFGGG